MDRLVQAKGALCQRSRRQHTDGAGDHRRLVRQNIAKDVGSDNHIKLVGIAHQLHSAVVHIHIGHLHLGVIRLGLFYDLTPQAGAVQHIGFVHAGQPLVPLHRVLKTGLDNALDLRVSVALRIIRAHHAVLLISAAVAEVNAAGQLAYNENVQPVADDLLLNGRSTLQRGKDLGRAQIGKQAQVLTNGQQTLFRSIVARLVVPLRAAHSAQQHRI